MEIKNNKNEKITLTILEHNIEVTIKYGKRSKLKRRLEVLDKLRKRLYTV